MSEPLSPDFAEFKMVLVLDGQEHVIAYEIFSVKDILSEETRNGEQLAPLAWDAYEKVVGDAQKQIGLWGTHGLIDAIREREAAKT